MLDRTMRVVLGGLRRAGDMIAALVGRARAAPPPVAPPAVVLPSAAQPPAPAGGRSARAATAHLAMPAVASAGRGPTPAAPPARPTSARRAASPERLRRLRRAAGFALFDACDLGPPPRSLWPLVDDANDVGGSVARFLRAVGADGDDAGAVLSELLRAEGDLAALPASQADAWRREIACGDPVRAAAAVRAVRAAAAGASRPGAGPPEEEAAAEHRRLRLELAASWPEHWIGGPAGDRVRASLEAFEEAELALAAPGTRAAALAAMARINDALARFAEAARRATAADPAPDPDSVASGTDEATSFADRLAAARDRDAALALWRAFRRRHHPDRPGLDTGARVAAERAAAAADRALDRWERSAGGAGAAAQP